MCQISSKGELSIDKFKLCDITGYANLIRDISDGLVDGKCDSKLQSAELIALFTQEKKDILSIAVDKIDARKICNLKGHIDEEAQNLEAGGYQKLDQNEFKFFVKLIAVQNLYFAKFDKKGENQSENQDGLITLNELHEKGNMTNFDCIEGKIPINLFRDALKGGGDDVKALFEATDGANSNTQDGKLTREEIKNYLTT